jgi:hypothetical protein
VQWTVPRGATGFRHHKAAPLPETDPRAVAGFSHALARNIGGTVEQIIPPSLTSTFYSVILACGQHDARRVTVLFHRHLPLLAVASHPPRGLDDLSIIDDPVVSEAMPDHAGFRLLTSGQLATPVTHADLSQLAAAELKQIASWKPKTFGEVLFNFWDLHVGSCLALPDSAPTSVRRTHKARMTVLSTLTRTKADIAALPKTS